MEFAPKDRGDAVVGRDFEGIGDDAAAPKDVWMWWVPEGPFGWRRRRDDLRVIDFPLKRFSRANAVTASANFAPS